MQAGLSAKAIQATYRVAIGNPDGSNSQQEGGIAVQAASSCRSVKVKRLFLWFAERHGFRWKLQIKEEQIDLGKGKRMLVRGGKLDPKYLITVPDDLDDGQ